MDYKYFSDVDLNENETISPDVWNGVVSIYEEMINTNKFAKYFPEMCWEYTNRCIGTDRSKLENKLKSHIPNLKLPIQIYNNRKKYDFDFESVEDDKPILNNMVDFIQFMYKHISNPKELSDNYEHLKFASHSHYEFDKNISEQKKDFLDEINTIFNRNNLNLKLQEDGEVIRTIPEQFEEITKKVSFSKNEVLNKLLNEAYLKFKSHRIEDRKIALERLWDSFERIKTFHNKGDKSKSAEELINLISDGNDLFKYFLNSNDNKLKGEFKVLTKFGNEFHIRHFETDKEEIKSSNHIDYLFYRMSALINLCLIYLNKG